MGKELAGTKVKLGEIGVDSGQVMVCDPCYLDEWKANEFMGGDKDTARTHEFSYDGACRETCNAPEGGGQLGDALAVVASSGYGDGTYPVYAEYNREGRLIRLTVEFDEQLDPEEEDDEEEEEDEE